MLALKFKTIKMVVPLTLRLLMSYIYIYIYIYIYDISSLRVNDLTLILLTWRKWWAPNNASKQQMRFNSGFKGLSCIRIFKRPCHTWIEVMLSVANEAHLPLSFCLTTQSRSFTLLLFPSVAPMWPSLKPLLDLYLPFLALGKWALRCSLPFISRSVFLLSPSRCGCFKW